MGQLFIIIYRLFRKNRWAFMLFLVLLIAFEAYFASRIRFEEDINKIIPKNEKVDKFLKVFEGSKLADRLVLHIMDKDTAAAPDPEYLVTFAERLIDSLETLPRLVSEIEGKFGAATGQEAFSIFYEHLPLFLDNKDYERIDTLISKTSVRESMGKNYRSLITPAGFAMKDHVLKDPLGLLRLSLEKLENLRVDENFSLYQGYIVSRDQRHLIFFVIPACPATETSQNRELIKKLDDWIRMQEQFAGRKVHAEYFGSVAISLNNASQIKKDIYFTVGIAAVLLFIFISLFFRRITILFYIFLPGLLGAGMAIALLYLLKGSVSAISLGLGAVMLGITIDYTLHFFTHLRKTKSVEDALRDISTPVITSSLTTASAFLCLLIVRSGALNDLGLFAAMSMFTASLFTLILIPQFIRPQDSNLLQSKPYGFLNFISRLTSYPFHKKKYLVLSIFLLLVIFFFTAKNVGFESDMSNMNYMSPELRSAEEELNKISSYKLKSLFVIAGGEDLNDALQTNERKEKILEQLKDEGIIQSYTSVSYLLPSDSLQKTRIRKWNDYWTGNKVRYLKNSILEAGARYKFRENAFNPFFEFIEKEHHPVHPDTLRKSLSGFIGEYISGDTSKTLVTSIIRTSDETKPKIYNIFQNTRNITIVDRTLLTSYFMDILRSDFNKLLLISLLIVFLILTLSFGRIELGIITFIPLLVSWTWTLGIMGILGIDFNIFNIVISTFILGLGIDYSIFLIRGLIQEYKSGYISLPSFKTSILLSGITTLVGLGVLILARHPALNSIAISALIGIITVIFISFTLLPVFFRFLIYHEKRKRKVPVTFKNFIFSINTVLIYFTGIILLRISAFILKIIFFIDIRKRKLVFHYMLMYACRIIVFGSVNIKKVIENWKRENFREPAIIISNHQSHLDLVLTIMLTPKLIVMTNEWVQNSPYFGWFIKFADYYPVTCGMDELVEKLQPKIKDGYSVLVFPEGSRSPDMQIRRFHQGAFYLAKRLNLAILPLIIHGTGDCMPKNEPFLKSGRATVRIFDRMDIDRDIPGETMLEKSRSMRAYILEKYGQLEQEVETPSYFRGKLVKNYIYKGPVLEWYLRAKLAAEDNYSLFHQLLPSEGRIVDVGCGYGFISYMMGFLSRNRIIKGIDYDERKINVANHCISKNERMEFIHADVNEYAFGTTDAFLIVDVLHYLPPSSQKKLLSDCIENLNGGGKMIIRDADAGMKKKHLGTKVSEFLSTRINFNKTSGDDKKLYFLSKERLLSYLDMDDVDVEIIDQTKLTSNIIFVVHKK